MNCRNCGFQNINGERFCKNCGSLLETNQPQINNDMYNQMPQQGVNPVQPNVQAVQAQQPVANPMQQNVQPMQQPMNQQYQNNNSNLDPNYVNQAVNPDMKKWAILSVVVPIIAIVWYWFIGLSFYLAVAIAAAGFGFAQKGEMANKKLATIGKVLNGILCGLAIIMLILQIIYVFI